VGLINFNFINYGTSGINILKDYIIPVLAPIIGVAGTYWFIFKPQMETQQNNFIKQQEEERERWIKDVYIKKEAEFWIEFRDVIEDILSYKNFIKILIFMDFPIMNKDEKLDKFFPDNYLIENIKRILRKKYYLKFITNKIGIDALNCLICYFSLREREELILELRQEYGNNKTISAESRKTLLSNFCLEGQYILEENLRRNYFEIITMNLNEKESSIYFDTIHYLIFSNLEQLLEEVINKTTKEIQTIKI